MSTLHDPNTVIHPLDRQLRCHRHHVWMAACETCRNARTRLGRTASTGLRRTAPGGEGE